MGAGIDTLRRGQELLPYYHRDEQFSAAFITGRQGEIRSSYQYDAFGVQLEAAEQFLNRIRYAGQQYDNSAQQYYLRARYYNPAFGRLMQEDTYWGDGLNLYKHRHNNQITYYEPNGHEKCGNSGQICGDGNSKNDSEKRIFYTVQSNAEA